jgi:threonine synthase
VEAKYVGLSCIRCGRPAGSEWSFEGCAHCRDEGTPANFECRYELPHVARLDDVLDDAEGAASSGLWRFRKLLPVDASTSPVSLGEGQTPLLRVRKLGEELGIHDLYIKDESRGPTWSYKDRLASVLVTKAKELGAVGIVVSSTGNHGAAIAAYAARADLPCIVLTVASAPAALKTQMQAYGAMVIAVERSTDRWTLMRECVDSLHWMPASGYVAPPVGSPAFGVEGYKTIAFELFEQLKGTPDHVIVPTSYSDGLYGTWKGFRELRDMGVATSTPRMSAGEALGSLEATLRAGAHGPIDVGRRPTVMFSIGTPQGTFQGLKAIAASGGTAVGSDDEAALGMQLTLAKTEGLYAEASAIAGITASSRLRRGGVIRDGESVVVVLTATGLKDPESTARALPAVPVIQPQFSALTEALRQAYHFAL